jgi:hypothetical protein
MASFQKENRIMANKPPLKLTAITDPKYQIELPSGEVRDIDPWKFSKDVEEYGAKDSSSTYDAIRKAAGFPTQAEIDAHVETPESPKPFTLSMHQCMEIQANILEFIDGLDVSKKLQRTLAKLSGSTASR